MPMGLSHRLLQQTTVIQCIICESLMPEMITLYVHVNVMSFAFVICNSSEINDDDDDDDDENSKPSNHGDIAGTYILQVLMISM